MSGIQLVLLDSIKNFLGSCGLRIEFDRPLRSATKLMAVKAAELRIGTLLDVGALFGEFVHAMRKNGYKGKAISFEPIAGSHRKLASAAQLDGAWETFQMALGAVSGSSEINVAKNLASSSLLPILSRSLEAAPLSGFNGKQHIKVRRLDDVVQENKYSGPFMMKLDAQGAELDVLRGAPETLRNTMLVMTEISLVPLYEGGATFMEVFSFFEQNGFKCIDIVPSFPDDARNELLQVDGIFVRAH